MSEHLDQIIVKDRAILPMVSEMKNNDPLRAYIELLKKSLLNELYLESELRISYLREAISHGSNYSFETLFRIRQKYPDVFSEFLKSRQEGRNFRRSVVEWPHTMIGRDRLDNLQMALESIIDEKIPGDVLEAGVWRGGASVFMRAVLDLMGGEDRIVWLADSFEGLPKPTLPEDEGFDFSKEKFPSLAIDLDVVQELFYRYGLPLEHVRFLKGWFKDTLNTANIGELALLRLDGDLYESTIDTLIPLYEKVSSGGFVIVDDYGAFPPCKKAVDEFRRQNGITAPLHQIDWTGAYWRKP